MSLAAETFTDNVISFCKWAEGKNHDLIEARQWMLTLMQSIPDLESFRGVFESDEDHERRGHEGWVEDHRRFKDLPFQFYCVVFDPHDLTENEPVTGDLHDDLADIYGDFFHGLSAYNKGFEKEAMAIWVDSYFDHWGQHAANALVAIDEYYRNNQETVDREP